MFNSVDRNASDLVSCRVANGQTGAHVSKNAPVEAGSVPGGSASTSSVRDSITYIPKDLGLRPKFSPLKSLKYGLLASVLMAMVIGGFTLWQHITSHQETDNAYITGHIHNVSSRVAGTVDKVLVEDNQKVKAGDLLVVLDPRDFEMRVKEAQVALAKASRQANAAGSTVGVSGQDALAKELSAEGNISEALASISKAQASVSEARAGVPWAKAQLTQSQANLHKAELDLGRFQVLQAQGAVSMQQLDAAKRDYDVALANRDASLETIRQAQSRVGQAQDAVRQANSSLVQAKALMQQARAANMQTETERHNLAVSQVAIDEARTLLEDAQLQLSYTQIRASVNGRIGKKTVEVGQRIQPGQTFLVLVSDEPWVVANFKETQLERMKVGQSVEIKIDAFPHHKFTGRVDSFAPASGAQFALLPPDNATGNFTKIVQRVPVKITFDKESLRGYEGVFVPGMSVIASVEIDK
jgi:membrane fusion protein (multidrug efflux system)